MFGKKVAAALLTLAFAVCVMPGYAQAPADVPQSHWAYEAVQSLAAQGLVKGYPPQGNFFGGRNVTRYEMVTIVQRILGRVEEMVSKAEPGKQPEAVTPAQLEDIRKLVDEFKVELTVIGTDLKQAKEDIAGLRVDVDALKAQLAKQAADVAEAKAAAGDAKKALAGAADAEKKQNASIAKLETGKVDAGFGKVKIAGLLQMWISAAEKSDPAAGVIDTFRVRRSQIYFTGSVNPKAYWAVTLDPICASTPVNQQLLDAYVGYVITPKISLQIGQQKIPLSMEGIRPSAQQYFVERSLLSVLPVNNGRLGNTYDIGAMAKLASPKVDAQLGVFNDGSNRQSTTDDNNAKEIVWHAQYKGVRYLTVGAYQEISGGVNAALRTLRNRQGLEAAIAYGRHKLEAEWAQARDGVVTGGVVTNPDLRSHGGYVAYLYRMNPTWEFGARGEYWNPDRDRHGAALNTEYDLTLGVNYYMMGNNSKIQFNWVRKNINGPLNSAGTGPAALSSLGPDRNMFMVNFQQAF